MKLPLEVVIERYWNNLYAAAYVICQNRQDAEDAAQDAFIQYYMTDRSFDSEVHIRAWLTRVTINRAKNICRKAAHTQALPEPDVPVFEYAPDRDLMLALLLLPEHYRIVIHLFYYDGYAVKEIAALLHLTQSAVKVRLSRGRKMLKEQLREGWNDDES